MENSTRKYVDLDKLAANVVCYSENIYRVQGVWDGPDPLVPVIPLYLLQLTIVMFTTRVVVLALKPLKQPPFVSEIITGIILGPSVFGRIPGFRKALYPNYNFRVLEPLAHFALCYYAFLTALQMDVKSITRVGSKCVNVAIGGFFIPFGVGSGLFFLFRRDTGWGCVFWGTSLSATGFHVLSKLLEKHKLNHTEMGKTAIGAAILSDMSSWIFLAFGLAVTNAKDNFPTGTLICTAAFVLFSVYYLRPTMAWALRKGPEGQGFSEVYICVVLTGVAIFGVVTDACGTHPIVGAFVYGLIIPNQVLEAALLDKLEDFVMRILMPAFYLVCGLRTNVGVMLIDGSWPLVVITITLSCSAKALGTLVVSCFCNMPKHEALAVGALANMKSVMVMIVLEIGQTQKVLTTQTYTIMVVSSLVMTASVTPMILIFWPSKDVTPYKRRTIQVAKPDQELRVLSCIHTTRNITPIINILTASNPTMKSPISVFALQLLELIGRASAGLTIHTSRRSSSNGTTISDPEVDQIINAFENFELRSEAVTSQTLTLRSAYSTMDEDICGIAKDKRAGFIILPFHKVKNPNGKEEEINPAIQSVNEGVLAQAPCSVGVLIDCGRLSESYFDDALSITMLYFGGPDDREALTLARRMAEHPDINLSVVRFIPGPDAIESQAMDFVNNGHVTLQIDMENEKRMDDYFLNKFNSETSDDLSITYSELELNDEEEAVNAIKAMEVLNYDLFVVGKGRGMMSPLTAGLADWCDCPELGAIGDLLVTSEFESAFSVLVIQQYVKASKDGEGSMVMRSSSLRSSSSSSDDDDDDDDGGIDKQLSAKESEGIGSLDSSFNRYHVH